MKLLALDGNSILNRAFYGIKLLTTKDGQYTNAIYGFLNILSKLKQDVDPDVVAIAFDLKGKTFRHEMYDGYKATRKGMPEELAQQLPVLKQLLLDLGYVIVAKEGYEADDVLGTLAAATKDGDECYIATGDRDSLQLVNDKVTVVLSSTQFGRSQNLFMNREAVFEKYGLYPEDLIDLKALMGDASDNIPGVKGVGEKTAVTLLQNFKTLEGVYENIESDVIKKGVREKLINDKEMAFLSRKLGTINLETPINTEFENYKRTSGNSKDAVKTLTRLEMFSMIEKLVETSGDTVEEKEEILLNEVIIKEFKNDLQSCFVYKNEDSFYFIKDENVYSIKSDSSILKEFLEDKTKEKIVYDSKELYEFGFLNNIDVKGVKFCLKLAAYLINPAQNSYDFERIVASSNAQKSFECKAYFASYIQSVYNNLSKEIKEDNQDNLLFCIEMPLAKVLASMEYLGFSLDKEKLIEFGEMLKTQLEKDANTVYGLVGYKFNLNSPKQLGKALFEDLELPTGKKTKSGYSTNAETLEGLKKYHPVIQTILNYRSYQKLNSTYVEGFIDKIKEDGRIHTTFNQTETRTGRISSGEPNLQNIPVRTKLGQELRKFFIAKEGHVLLDADYSQIELRILAHISKDEVMCEAFNSNLDIHTQTAAKVMKLPVEMVTSEFRSRAKAVNFGIVYGIGAFSLAKDINISVKEADSFIKEYLENFKGVKKYMDDIVITAKENGYVTTLFNRKRLLPEINNSNKMIQALGKRMALNTPIQGTSADIIKIAMVKVYNRLEKENLKAKLVLQVHDELIVECPKQEQEIVSKILKQEMENAATLIIPLKADVNVGENWYDAKG